MILEFTGSADKFRPRIRSTDCLEAGKPWTGSARPLCRSWLLLKRVQSGRSLRLTQLSTGSVPPSGHLATLMLRTYRPPSRSKQKNTRQILSRIYLVLSGPILFLQIDYTRIYLALKSC